MFFENEYINVQILDVLKITQGCSKTFNSNRNFDALSFRFNADTELKTETAQFHVGDNSICFVPARINYTRATKKDNMIIVHFYSLNGQFKEIEYFYPSNPQKYADSFCQLLCCWQEKKKGYKYAASSLLYRILSETCAEKQMPPKNCSDPRIENAVTYLLKNFAKSDITTSEIAMQAYMSEVYFRKLFKQEFGVSPRQYIIGLRIKNAEKLISTGYYTIQEIACQCGFTDYKYFSAEFKKRTGISPAKYGYRFGNR